MDWEESFSRARFLADQGTPQARDELIGMSEDPHQSVRCAVASALGNYPGPEALDALVTLLSDPEVWVRIRAVQALGRFRGTKAPDYLVQHLETEKDEKVRATIVKTIGGFADERFIPVLLPYLSDDDARVRANTIEGLGCIPSPDLQKILRPFLDDPNSRIRANTARIMSRFADTLAVSRKTFKTMLASDDQYERASAVYALGELKDRNFIDDLLALLRDKSFVVRRNVLDALGKYGKVIEKPLIPLLESDDPIVRTACCEILGRIGTTEGRSALIPHLDDSDGEVRSQAERALDLMASRSR